MTRFAEMDEHGNITNEVELSPAVCPHFIMVPEHYREDKTCRCDDPNHKEMHEWGYQWDEEKKAWV